ncbi:MAG: mucoidy inhibitor MuiA family protein [Verrucomicrobia bacterium]|nr:mucoidy inhibitor MuiA family protein [Verrucomicrobiota bacterium]
MPIPMLHPSCFLLAALTLSVAAADIPTTNAKVHTVTVYGDRAEVVRHLSATVEAGDHSLTFENLPGATDLSSVRVDGKGAFTLIDIRGERIQTKEVADERVLKLNKELEALRAQLNDLTLADNRITQRKGALEKVLGRLTSVGKESANAEMDPSKWAAYLQYHVDTLAKLDQETLANSVTRQGLTLDVDRVQRELNELNAHRFKFRNVARVRIEAKQAGPIELDLAYVVRGPSWNPLYDIRADTQAKTIQVNYHAEVRQSTGEDWKGVALKLSTAQPNLGGREPLMSPWFIHRFVPPPVAITGSTNGVADGNFVTTRRAKQGSKSEGEQTVALGGVAAAPAPAAAAMEFSYARVNTGGTAATFAIPRAYDVPSDNKPAKVAIASESFPSEFRHTCVPKLSPHVYLKAKAINKSDFPFIAGPTAVFLDGAFVANASLDLVAPGQEFWTYLGADQSVKVDLKDLGKVEELSGLFGKKTARSVVSKVFKVTNGKATEVQLSIRDQVPSSNHEEIKVVFEEPKYEKDTDGFKVDDSKFVEWNLTLKPGAKQDVPFRFAIERPEGFPLVGQ